MVSKAVETYVMDPDVFPLESSGIIDDSVPARAQEVFYDSPIEFRTFARHKGTNYPIDGLVPLATIDHAIQHLPSQSLSDVESSPSVPIRQGYSGRVCDIQVETARGETKSYSVINTAVGPGRVYAKLRDFHARSTGNIPPYGTMNYGYAIFQENPALNHPLTSRDPEMYEHQNDYEFMGTVTGKDPNPSDTYVDHILTGPRGEKVPVINMLSELVRDIVPDVAKRYESKEYAKGIDELISGFGRLYADLRDVPPGDKKTRLEDLLASNLNSRHGVAQELGVLYIDLLNDDLFALRIPVKAALMYERLANFQRDHKRLSGDAKRRIEAERDHIRKEFVQPLNMAKSKSVLLERLAVLHMAKANPNEPFIDPFRYSVTGLDKWDIHFARLLGSKIKSGTFAGTAADVQRNYGSLDPKVNLVLIPSGGVDLQRHMSIKKRDKALVAKGLQAISTGETMPAPAVKGAFYYETVLGVYDDTKPNIMDGIAARMSLKGPGMRSERNHLYMSLHAAPGLLFRVLERGGALGSVEPAGLGPQDTRDGSTVPQLDRRSSDGEEAIQGRSMAYMLGASAVSMKPLFAVVEWDEDKRDFEVIGALEQGDAFQVVGTQNGADVRINPAKVLTRDEAEVARRRAEGRNGESIGRILRSSIRAKAPGRDINRMGRGAFTVVGEHIRRNEMVLAKVAILGGTVHIGAAREDSHGARIAVMRSEGRVDPDAIEAQMDEELLNDD